MIHKNFIKSHIPCNYNRELKNSTIEIPTAIANSVTKKEHLSLERCALLDQEVRTSFLGA